MAEESASEDCIAVDLDQYVLVPGLTANGFPTIQRVQDGKLIHGAEGKRCCLSPSGYPIQRDEFELCKEWITRFCKPRKTPSRWGSYGLKHVVERFYSGPGQRGYVSNGALIAAAIACGYEPLNVNGPNAEFAFWINVDGFEGSEGYLNGRRPTNGYV